MSSCRTADGVEVLRQPIDLAVLPRPQREQTLLVPVRVGGTGDRHDLLFCTNSGYFERWSVNTSGVPVPAVKAGDLGPVVIPGVLLDRHRDVRIDRVERVRTGLVGRQLEGVPQPILDRTAGGAAFGRLRALRRAGCGSRRGSGGRSGRRCSGGCRTRAVVAAGVLLPCPNWSSAACGRQADVGRATPITIGFCILIEGAAFLTGWSRGWVGVERSGVT